jgi:ATP-binding cassette subfamily B (MDR/TAP) protein 1
LLRQEYAYFDRQENSVGALTSSLATNPTSAAQLSTTVSWWLQIATVLAGCLGLALGTGWKLALVVSSMLPVLIGAAIFQMRSGSRKQADLDLPAATAQEAIAGIRTVMALGLQARAARAYEDALEAPYRADRRQALIVGVGYGLSLSVMFYTYALAYWYGGGLVASGEYTFRQMVTSKLHILDRYAAHVFIDRQQSSPPWYSRPPRPAAVWRWLRTTRNQSGRSIRSLT